MHINDTFFLFFVALGLKARIGDINIELGDITDHSGGAGGNGGSGGEGGNGGDGGNGGNGVDGGDGDNNNNGNTVIIVNGKPVNGTGGKWF